MNRLPLLRHLGPRRARSLGSDDEGALPVFEAIIAGMLVLTAILFLTAIGRPGPAAGQSGIDLGQNAADTLSILRDRDADDPDAYPNRLAEMVDEAMVGDPSGPQSFLDEIVPTGTRYLLRLDNGVEPLILLPEGSGPSLTPRAAQAAAVLLTPDWRAMGDPSDWDGIVDAISPGEEIPAGHDAEVATTTTFLMPPTGDFQMPDGTTWRAYWQDPGQVGTVPLDVPYGVWASCSAVDCATNPSSVSQRFLVVPPSGQIIDHPVYGVQLVVWLAA